VYTCEDLNLFYGTTVVTIATVLKRQHELPSNGASFNGQ